MTTTVQADKVIFNGGTSADLQAAINTAITQGKSLYLVPGFTAPSTVTNVFTANNLQISTTRPFRMYADPGTVTLKLGQTSDYVLSVVNSSDVEISGIAFDASYNAGAGSPILANLGAIYVQQSKRTTIEKCKIFGSSTNGIHFFKCGTTVNSAYGPAGTFDDPAGVVSKCEIYNCNSGTGIVALSSPGLKILKNTLRDIKGNAISLSDYDFAPVANSPSAGNTTYKSYFNGAQIEGNFISDIAVINTSSTGGEGNAIMVWLANQITIANNTIRYCKFSAVRINSCSQVVINGNNCYAIGESALYIEEPDGAYVQGKNPVGSVVSNNIVNHCYVGVNITNFLYANSGNRLVSITGNVIRNAHKTGKYGGIGISAEGDCAITGNMVECAENVGIALGTNNNTRDLLVVGNVVRNSPYGIGVADSSSAGAVLISSNMLHQASANTGTVAMTYDPSTTGPSALYSTGALADGQTAKPWVKLSNNYTSLLATPTVSTDGCEVAFAI